MRIQTRTVMDEEADAEIDVHPLVTGIYIGKDAVSGKAVVCSDKSTGSCLDSYSSLEDKILVIKEADNTWFPLVRKARAVILEEGSVANHFVQMLREMNKPSVVCAVDATRKIKPGQDITLFSENKDRENHKLPHGNVVDGIHGLRELREELPDYPATKTKVYSICAFEGGIQMLKDSPMAGIGLLRADFLNNYLLGVHPVAMADYARRALKDQEAVGRLDRMFGELYGVGRTEARAVYVDMVAQHIHQVAQHIPGKRINYRLFDLNSGEACQLIGGKDYEPNEKNPMSGVRGNTKMISAGYRPGLELECEIIKTVIEKYGVGLHLVIPFCRTPQDGRKAVELIRKLIGNGVAQPEIGGMAEIPANVIMADRYADVFDFLIFGPMDMTQSLFMADRGCTGLAEYCNYDNDTTRESVNVMLRKLNGCSKDIFIISYEVFSGLGEFKTYQGDNRLHMISFPDNFEKDLHRLKALEERVGL